MSFVASLFFIKEKEKTMLKETIKYVDYNGTEREEDFYFNLSKAELFEMQMGTTGGYEAMINRIIAAQDAPALIKIFKEIILKAYGVKSADGKQFIKSEELSAAFSQTEAYVNLYMKLVSDSDAAAKFVNGIMPANVSEQIAKQ